MTERNNMNDFAWEVDGYVLEALKDFEVAESAYIRIERWAEFSSAEVVIRKPDGADAVFDIAPEEKLLRGPEAIRKLVRGHIYFAITGGQLAE